MTRAAYWMLPDRRGLVERRTRGDRAETLGFVEEAPYLARESPGFLARWFGAQPRLRLAPPFDAAGRDVLGLLDPSVEPLAGEGDATQVVRRAAGRVACLSPREQDDAVVLRDLWVGGERPRRVVDAVHFALEPEVGPPIAVAFAQSPLVIGVPELVPVGTHLAGLPAELSREARPALDGDEQGQRLSICEGDAIEVVGLTWDPDRCERRFELGRRTASYRDVQMPIRLVLGDAPGLRMVIRIRGEGATEAPGPVPPPER